MKKIFAFLFVTVLTLGAHAQFESGTHYAGANLTGLGIGYEKGNFSFGIGAEYGYYVSDGWMVGATVGYRHLGDLNAVLIKPSFRYSFVQNGLNLGCGIQLEHAGSGLNYAQFCPQVGYTFYLNRNVSIEPAIYADICMNEPKDGSTVGLKIGFGLYK